ncbi:hypothetical protein MHB50_09590 [Siminovitchia sp. FSL H7-0308]|uniref:Secreted protein n=1 Tax=Siminovitchia thermophila TaxID=1245522 RepID=A0ABS2RCS6_9BACI|nr:hypothetical protein [Siminovitchia thermophila]MBM7716638.1 hypothetical protein [Siminovitchia thermophila]ONK24327.1 hypothetical protein BLX87_05700 [Bacillus sp. VT-16-64]
MLKKPFILMLLSGFMFTASSSECEDVQSVDDNGSLHIKANTKQAIDPELASLQEPTIGEATVEEPFSEKKNKKQSPDNNETSMMNETD